MTIQMLRKKQQLSQERLADATGLSLRTIQRVEAGHRVGYASMRALAAHFQIDVDTLEQSLYGMDTLVDAQNTFPRSVRHCFGQGGWHASTRNELVRVE